MKSKLSPSRLMGAGDLCCGIPKSGLFISIGVKLALLGRNVFHLLGSNDGLCLFLENQIPFVKTGGKGCGVNFLFIFVLVEPAVKVAQFDFGGFKFF